MKDIRLHVIVKITDFREFSRRSLFLSKMYGTKHCGTVVRSYSGGGWPQMESVCLFLCVEFHFAMYSLDHFDKFGFFFSKIGSETFLTLYGKFLIKISIP